MHPRGCPRQETPPKFTYSRHQHPSIHSHFLPDDRYPQGTPHGWRPTRSGIYTRHMITIETFRTHRHSRPTIVDDPDILVIRRGYRVRLHGDRNAQTWEIWRSINVARLHALDYQSTQPLVFTGNSAYFSTESRHGRRTPASRRGPVSRPSMFGLIPQYTIDERSCRAPGDQQKDTTPQYRADRWLALSPLSRP